MKFLSILLVAFSFSLNASEVELVGGKNYVVPNNEVWIIKDVPVLTCKVCTADLNVKGQASQVEVNGVIFSGNFEVSFSSKVNGPVKIYSGTSFWLGDSRNNLLVAIASR